MFTLTSTSTSRLWVIIAIAVGLITTSATAEQRRDRSPESWEPAIQRFEAADREATPQPGGILFVGSSSTVGWKVDHWFPDVGVLNRGFGGSTVIDVNHFFDRVVVPYRPSTIVFYSGDNDVAVGKTTEQIVHDYRTFLGHVSEKLPKARVILVALKPSLARWKLWPAMQEVNHALRTIASEHFQLAFLDVSKVMLDPEGSPDSTIFVADGLHMNKEGYRRWSELIRPLFEAN